MPTKKVEVGLQWVAATTDNMEALIECISGSGVIVAASVAPDDQQYWGHSLNVGETVTASEPTFVRAKPGKGDYVLVIT